MDKTHLLIRPMHCIINVKCSGSDNRARVMGGWNILASSTASPEEAARRAAEKLCKRLGRPYSDITFKTVIKTIGNETWLLTLPDVEGVVMVPLNS